MEKDSHLSPEQEKYLMLVIAISRGKRMKEEDFDAEKTIRALMAKLKINQKYFFKDE